MMLDVSLYACGKRMKGLPVTDVEEIAEDDVFGWV